MLIEIGKRIRQIRVELVKCSQFEFSEQMAMTQANLSMIENGKIYPSCFLLMKLCVMQKINLNWLFIGTGEMVLPLLLDTSKENIKTTDNQVVI
jgi:transcriptional regulator with XRE-family HTH domain